MNTENGGPAFPHEYKFGDGTAERADGMTLRDYFAAKAMQGLLAQSCGTAPTSSISFGAEYAYQMADAMLQAREL